jgi:hypothetical protein
VTESITPARGDSIARTWTSTYLVPSPFRTTPHHTLLVEHLAAHVQARLLSCMNSERSQRPEIFQGSDQPPCKGVVQAKT